MLTYITIIPPQVMISIRTQFMISIPTPIMISIPTQVRTKGQAS